VRAVDVVDADVALASQLEIPAGLPVLRVDRVRYADDEPMAVEQVYLPLGRFPEIESADWGGGSLFELLAERGVRLGDADQRVVAAPIDGDDARRLNVAAGEPGLRFASLARDVDGQPVYCAVSLFRGDRYEIELRQQRMEER
jgi:GntR family transcriptional regulator